MNYCIQIKKNEVKIYQGTYLSISFENEKSRFVQHWNRSPINIDVFKKEMIEYTLLYKKFNPEQSLWLQQNFTLNLNLEAHKWLEEKVNIPCKEYGNKKLAFVVSKDVLAHIKVINSFEELNSCIVPKHFLLENEARNWLDGNFSTNKRDLNSKISFEGKDENGNSIFKIKTSNIDISSTLKSIKEVSVKNEYIKINVHSYLSLTTREKEILHLFSKNQNLKEIATRIFISHHTIRTHWKNIKRKLNLESNDEILYFSKAYNPRKIESYLNLLKKKNNRKKL